MKTHLVCLAVGALIIAGCDGNSQKPTASTNTTSSGTSPLNAPSDYLGAMAKGQQSAVKTVDTASLNRAIQMFSVEHGRNPKDLDELVAEKYLPRIPAAPFGMKLVYDPGTGVVKVVKQ